MNKIAHVFLRLFPSSNERYVFKEQSRISLATTYISTLHTHAHLDLIVWFNSLWIRGLTLQYMFACMLFHALTIPMNSIYINLSVWRERHITFIALVRIHKYHVHERFESVMQWISEFYFETYENSGMMVQQRIWDIVLTWLFYLSIAQDQVKAQKLHGWKEIWVSLKVRLVNFNLEENSCLNACVLLSCAMFVKP
jgi:hypothetical protein